MADPRSEFAFIDWLRSRTATHPAVGLGIGDDGALLRIPPPGECLITVDMLMEGVDFLPETDLISVGHKALAVSLSDIAAMAGRPLAAVISVALPRRSGRPVAEQLYAGLEATAREFDVAIAGGDTNSWDGPLVISSTLIGEPTGGGPVCRKGARPGDWIMVTGELGGSLAGKHLNFQPRVREAQALRTEPVSLHAMIDISDGLAADLHHILEESGVGAIVRAEQIPISEAARRLSNETTAGKNSVLAHALGDGEDFELLFTVSPDDGQQLLAHPPFELRISHLGEITADRTCALVDPRGNSSPLQPQGWVHSLESP